MHARFLVDAAAMVASCSREMLRQTAAVEEWYGELFWVASRARVNHWTLRLKALGERQSRAAFDPSVFWGELEPILEEIFLAEVATRVWCAILTAADKVAFPGELDPIARSVFVASLEVRRRALRLLLFARGLPGVSTTSLNRLRFDCELWTDQLLAYIAPSSTSALFSLEKRRFRLAARELRRLGQSRRGGQVLHGQLMATRCAMGLRRLLPSTCGEMNWELGALMVGCLPATQFDHGGVPRGGWTLDAFHSDLYAISVLAELCGHEPVSRSHPEILGDR